MMFDGDGSEPSGDSIASRTATTMERELRRDLANEITQTRIAVEAALGALERDHLAALAAARGTPRGPAPPEHLSPEAAAHYRLLSTSPLMDGDWYRQRYSDVRKLNFDPVLHYLEHGGREGRQPSSAFDAAGYLEANPDVAARGHNALVHYLLRGAAEGRPLRLGSRADFVLQTSPDRLPSVEEMPSEPRLWFYVGDTLEWMRDQVHLTGVGRVTSELLFSALEALGAGSARPCVASVGAGHGKPPLARLTNLAPIEELARRIGRETKLPGLVFDDAEDNPREGDHVFFTGLVWTPTYTDLFRRLAAHGIGLSVLVHDIIPLMEPSIASEAIARGFRVWLETVMETATCVFISNASVAQELSRWCVAAGIGGKAQLRVVTFGHRPVSAASVTASPRLEAVLQGGEFVLCVGTIDIRKNQRLLLGVWRELLRMRGPGGTPRLVFAGRDDLRLAEDPTFAELNAAGKTVILSSLSDAEVAALYEGCLFTIFPSWSEGYGLPVGESLARGKLCLAGDLPAIRAHAGNHVRYFEPRSEADALRLVEATLNDRDGLSIAETRIRTEHRLRSWTETYDEMQHAVHELEAAPQPARSFNMPGFVGATASDPLEILDKARRWCVGADPQVSIIILNWNSGRLARACIRQVWAVTEGAPYEIIVVDNGSEAAERTMLAELGGGVRFIELGCNRFFGEANNIGVEAATGTYVCLLNNDAFVTQGWLRALLDPFTIDPKIGATGPLFVFPHGGVQEAGGWVDEAGFPERAGRNLTALDEKLRFPHRVDYISAAALMVERALFIQIGGFDLAYEPVYYEDTDLCFKIVAFGRDISFRPDAVVMHIEGASSNGDEAAERRRRHLGDLNRDKFVARWGNYLRQRDEASLATVRTSLPLAPTPTPRTPKHGRAVVYTPEPLTPGGGERYLLTLTERLLDLYDVTLVTAYPYSRMRVLSLGAEFSLNLQGLRLSHDFEAETAEAPELQVVMGNHIVPPVHARGRRSYFHCQFPFPLDGPPRHPDRLAGYDGVWVNSRYTALHCEAAIDGLQLNTIPLHVLPPPVKLLNSARSPGNRPRILSVGRFFTGGHSKRQDLLIDAFKSLANDHGIEAELHLAGSSHPSHDNMAYLAELMARAAGYPIRFHVNASAVALCELFASATVYWHGTGLETDLVAKPWAAEHFGITVVEAMSAGATPFALASAGPREIITPGVDGFLFRDLKDLVSQTTAFLAAPDSVVQEMSQRARTRAADYAVTRFRERLDSLIEAGDAAPTTSSRFNG